MCNTASLSLRRLVGERSRGRNSVGDDVRGSVCRDVSHRFDRLAVCAVTGDPFAHSSLGVGFSNEERNGAARRLQQVNRVFITEVRHPHGGDPSILGREAGFPAARSTVLPVQISLEVGGW